MKHERGTEKEYFGYVMYVMTIFQHSNTFLLYTTLWANKLKTHLMVSG